MAYARKHGALPVGDMAALRQSGRTETHPADCTCRKCRRADVARAGRVRPRYGQQPGGLPPDTVDLPRLIGSSMPAPSWHDGPAFAVHDWTAKDGRCGNCGTHFLDAGGLCPGPEVTP